MNWRSNSSKPYPLDFHVTSKAERGFMLVSGEHPQPVKAPASRYSADATLDEAIATIIGGSIIHFAANWPPWRRRDIPKPSIRCGLLSGSCAPP